MKRVICVWLPNWPITRLSLANPDCAAPDKPLAIVAVSGAKRRIAAVNRVAHGLGVMAGQRLTDAKAIAPDLVSVAADREADTAALGALSRWAQRFTPSTAVNPPGGLWLDITGCARLWRGEKRLVEALVGQLSARGIPCRAAVADTFGAAWAFARLTDRYHILPPGGHRDPLAELPLGAMRLSAETLAGLRRLGLKTVGQAMALPRADLARRFPDLLARLDQAMGDAPEAIAFEHPPSPWFESAAFADFISTPEDLARTLELLAGRLCRRFAEAGQGGRRFEASFFGADNSIQRIGVATSLPSRDAKAIVKLLTPRLETIDPGFGVEVVTLRAGCVEPLAERQLAFGERKDVLANIAPLIDKLGNRLGLKNVWRVAASESHLPERSVMRVAALPQQSESRQKPPFGQKDAGHKTRAMAHEGRDRAEALAEPALHVWPNGAARPIRLLSYPEPIEVMASLPDHPPIQFRWRRVLRRVRRAEGPERIAPEWWHEPTGKTPRQIRDYYRVEDESGARFWLYRDGLYADGAPRPRWFIHGFLP
jgi:protein ImuB